MRKALASQVKLGRALPPVCNYNFEVQEKYRFDQPFIFGDTVSIEHEEIHGIIQRVSRSGHPIDVPYESRNVVIIGHSFFFDQNLLASNNISIPGLDILDTCGIAQYLFKEKVRPERPEDFQLKSLLQHFEIPGDHFHVAGNDSNFTLKLLLMLAVMNSQDERLNEEQQAIKSALMEIAHAPWPKFFWKRKREQDLEMMPKVQKNRTMLKAELIHLLEQESNDNIMDLFDEQE